MKLRNAIQCGLDQLLEAPTPKLISFIHWFYWSQNVAGLVMYYMIAGGSITARETVITHNAITTALIVLITMATVAALVLICGFKKHFYIQKAGLNPFKNIYSVLKYAWNHKVPECHSAFTFTWCLQSIALMC